MKLNPEFILQDMQGDVSVLVQADASGKSFRSILRLNETAAFIVKQL